MGFEWEHQYRYCVIERIERNFDGFVLGFVGWYVSFSSIDLEMEYAAYIY